MRLRAALSIFAFSAAACAVSNVDRVSAAERYEPLIGRCTQLPDMEMQTCLADLNEKALAEEKKVVGANAEVDCEKETERFKGGTGYWSTAYICSIRSRAKHIDASPVAK